MHFHPAIAAFLIVMAPPGHALAQDKVKKDASDAKESKEKFDTSALLAKIALKVDKDGDGALSLQEFRKLPLVKEIKKERINELFADIDEDGDDILTVDEISNGFGKILQLAKDETALLKKSDAKSKKDTKKKEKQSP